MRAARVRLLLLHVSQVTGSAQGGSQAASRLTGGNALRMVIRVGYFWSVF